MFLFKRKTFCGCFLQFVTGKKANKRFKEKPKTEEPNKQKTWEQQRCMQLIKQTQKPKVRARKQIKNSMN